MEAIQTSTILKSDRIYNMEHIRILDTKSSSVFLSPTNNCKNFEKRYKNNAKQVESRSDGVINPQLESIFK